MDWKNKTLSFRNKIIISFSMIMTLTILAISIFVSQTFESEFGKYVDDSNKSELNHLITIDLKNIYKAEIWQVDLIRKLGEDYIEKGIVLEVYDDSNRLIYTIFEENQNLSNKILDGIKENMENLESNWKPKLEENKVKINDENGNLVGYAYIQFYKSLYYMENDIVFLNIINNFMKIVAFISISIVILISIVISKSISTPIEKVSSITKDIGYGIYSDKITYKVRTKEVKELVESINKLSYKLYNQEKLRKRITTDISHELRTPLTSIQGHLDAMIDGIWDISKERLISIREETSRLSELIGRLRLLSKYDGEENILRKTKTDLQELIKHIIYNYESSALKKNIKINYNLETVYFDIDKSQFSQVIVNLLCNAIKYTEYNGEINIGLYDKKDYIIISIKDNGVGIPEKDIEFIFERFYRVDKSRDKETGGIGIGLSIVKSIINAHGGRIFVSSKINEGTEFIIKLPK